MGSSAVSEPCDISSPAELLQSYPPLHFGITWFQIHNVIPSMDLFIALPVVTSCCSGNLTSLMQTCTYHIADKSAIKETVPYGLISLCLDYIFYHGKCFPPWSYSEGFSTSMPWLIFPIRFEVSILLPHF